MNLPKNGRIVIIDDKISEAQPLIQVLSKRRIPFNYYSGTDIKDFPENPENNKFRILFLDLNIFEQSKSEKQVISTLHSILVSIIPPNPNPYLLIIWSKQNETYKTALELHFSQNLNSIQPAKIIFLQKTKYFDLVGGDWEPMSDAIERIEVDLKSEVDSISLLGPLIFWENLVHDSVSETITDFSTFHKIDSNWNNKMKPIVYKMAKALVGKDDISKLESPEKLRKAFHLLSELLSDKVEYALESSEMDNIHNINDDRVDEEVVVSLNTRLHCLSNKNNLITYYPGNLYIINDLIGKTEKILDVKIFKSATQELLESSPLLIQMDVTPICDYSQDKDYIRTIFGVAINSSLFNKIKDKRKDFHYMTPLIELKGERRFILFDFRFISTSNKEFYNIRGLAPLLRIRRELCMDIQARLSSQINRPGVSEVN